ncbi:MAG: carbonic anhydrase [Acidobacteriota bacterium]|nr:carbonic anhydrase [Acidobacteriota bacterium]
MPFNDLLAANAEYAAHFDDHHFDGKAQAGVLMLTCMDSRIEPLGMIGLQIGDAKILRTPGAHLTPDALIGCILGVHALNVKRIMVVAHTRCAVASETDDSLRAVVAASSGRDVSELVFGADPHQRARLVADVETLRNHELVGPFAEVGGFSYDVDWGRLTLVV